VRFPNLAVKANIAFPPARAAIDIAHMTKLFRLFALIASISALALAVPGPASADQQDVAATVRGVVRVVIIATNGKDSYFVGHGSGFAVAPDKVLTNAHVVELVRTEPNLVLGIIPSQGKRSYGGRILAFSPGNDLALIQVKGGNLPVATFFAGSVADGQHVTAIGYPATVDRAQGLDTAQMVQPLSPVKTSGTISTGRASKDFDTVLHTAPMAQGNSGGPLVDDCGRVLGVNSFGSEAESTADAEFGFAVSDREVASFLRQAGVQFQRSAAPCRSIAELDAEEAKRQAEASAQAQQHEAQAALARQKALDSARDQAEQDIVSSRENAMAIAGILLLLGGLSLGGAMMFHAEHKAKQRRWAMIGGGVLVAGAIAAFALRPSFSSIEERIHVPDEIGNSAEAEGAPFAAAGDNLCTIDAARSRIVVSETEPVKLNWRDGGCVNGGTQYGRSDGTSWSRILVPASDDAISINSFDPANGTYKVERYLPDADVMEQARTLRAQVTFNGCTTDPGVLDQLQRMQRDIRATLPAQPNERLFYKCGKPKPEPTTAPPTQ
jgi:S1-C subfamily serine protease